MIKLIGLLVVVLGFVMRANLLLVVMVAGIVTGLLSGMTLSEVMREFGRLFVENRYVSLPVILMVPVIGLLERHGLRERAETLIRQSKATSAGRVLWLYATIRQISIALGINIGGHAGAVRPLVSPMAEAAAHLHASELTKEDSDDIRAHAAASENIGNFFGEDIFIAVGAVLLMRGFFETQGVLLNVWAIALWGIPTALIAFVAMGWRARALDRRLAKRAGQRAANRSCS